MSVCPLFYRFFLVNCAREMTRERRDGRLLRDDSARNATLRRVISSTSMWQAFFGTTDFFESGQLPILLPLSTCQPGPTNRPNFAKQYKISERAANFRNA